MLEQRIQVRETVGQDPSDATLQVLKAQHDKAAPLRIDEQHLAITVDTSQENYVQALLKNLNERLGSGIDEQRDSESHHVPI